MRKNLPRAYRVYLAVLGLAALVCAAVIVALAAAAQRRTPQALYLLKDNAGHLALYASDGTGPLAQYDIATRLLPEDDVLALQQGVAVYSDAELQRKLEDYGM